MDDWGSYFSAKKAKLNEQFNTQGPENNCKQIFQGISIYINGYTNPPEPELRELFSKHGGQYSQYFLASTTFVIATNLPAAKKRHMAKKTLRPEWITDSIVAGIKQDFRKYFLYDSNEEQNQRTLTQVVEPHATTKENDSVLDDTVTRDESSLSPNSSSIPICESQNEPETETPSPGIATAISPERSLDDGQQRHAKLLKSTTEVGFLDDFYNNSRLHLISTMKKHIQQLVAGWRRNANPEFKLLHQYLLDSTTRPTASLDSLGENLKQVVMHVDIDCFFVAVGRLTRPHLANLPVAVTHSKGTTAGSKSEIACVSYEGRAKGIYAGMWLDQAKRLCPELQTMPYEFEEYKRVSTLFFETVASLTLEIEPVSCDELYIDATKIIVDSGTSPTRLANFLRNAVKDSAKISCSIGIGNNKLSARIATRQAKENGTGTCHLTESELKEFIVSLPAHKLPGVGYSTTEKLRDFYKIETCGELQRLTLHDLKSGFGDKNGEKLYWLCRGVDNDALKCDNTSYQAKSISAGCSFGVRFTDFTEVNTFIKQLSTEVAKRAEESEGFGKKITLSFWVVKKGHIHEPVKPGAHGAVDVHSRTRPLHIPTRDPKVLAKIASELGRSITKTSIPANYIRGVRISLDNLRYEYDMTATEKKSVQSTINDSFGRRDRRNPSSDNVWSVQSAILHNMSPLSQDAEVQEDTRDGDGPQVERDPLNPASQPMDTSEIISDTDTTNGNVLPFLNAVNKISDIKSVLVGGIKSKHIPNHEDRQVLASYLQELLTGNHVDEGRELISYIWQLICKLQSKEDEVSLRWASTFLNILKTSQADIRDMYCDSLELATSISR